MEKNSISISDEAIGAISAGEDSLTEERLQFLKELSTIDPTKISNEDFIAYAREDQRLFNLSEEATERVIARILERGQ